MDIVICGRHDAVIVSVLCDCHGGPTINVVASSEGYHLFVHRSHQTKDYYISIRYFSANYVIGIMHYVSNCTFVFVVRLHYKIQLSVWVKHKAGIII